MKQLCTKKTKSQLQLLLLSHFPVKRYLKYVKNQHKNLLYWHLRLANRCRYFAQMIRKAATTFWWLYLKTNILKTSLVNGRLKPIQI